ncbi:MAG: glycosyltransferase family 9 protein, partial [Candidatus Omnitrophica bacterium]|nr:glycosyltransferase family 9 protein [Candidatus Omnitrophota bacterium]
VNLGGIGDFLLSTPALRALKGRFPKAQLAALVNSSIYELAKDLTYIDEVFTFSLKYGELIPLARSLENFLVLMSLRRKRFDIAINMRTLVSAKGARKINFIFNLINPKIKAGRNTNSMGTFFDLKIPETLIGEKYEMEYDIDTVRTLGAEVKSRDIDFSIDEKSYKKIEHILTKNKIARGDKIIGLHLGGKPSHRWPIKNFVKAIKIINDSVSCRFIATGTGDEKQLVLLLKTVCEADILDLSGQLNLKELGALIKRCNLYISNDTGPMHISAVLNTPLLAIFGPGYLTRFDPRNISTKAVVIKGNADCSPCENTICNDLRCLSSIDPEVVAGEALKIFRNQ